MNRRLVSAAIGLAYLALAILLSPVRPVALTEPGHPTFDRSDCALFSDSGDRNERSDARAGSDRLSPFLGAPGKLVLGRSSGASLLLSVSREVAPRSHSSSVARARAPPRMG